MLIDLKTTGATVAPATDSPASGTPKPTVLLKNCCHVPREQSCKHDLPVSAFEPGCAAPIMCRPASEWGA